MGNLGVKRRLYPFSLCYKLFLKYYFSSRVSQNKTPHFNIVFLERGDMKINNKIGFTIVELIVALGIMSIMGFAFTAIVINSNKEMKALEMKADSLSLKSSVEGTLSNLNICSCLMDSYASTFDADNIATAASNITTIKSSCEVAASTVVAENADVAGTKLAVDKIKIENIEYLGVAESYKGKLRINYQQSVLGIRPLRPISFDIRFKTQVGSPSNAKKIVLCDFVGGGGGMAPPLNIPSCPPDQYLRGIQDGQPLCSAVVVAGNASDEGAADSSGVVYSATNPGPGCRGDFCKTTDFGQCRGDFCKTNGGSCIGDFCETGWNPKK